MAITNLDQWSPGLCYIQSLLYPGCAGNNHKGSCRKHIYVHPSIKQRSKTCKISRSSLYVELVKFWTKRIYHVDEVRIGKTPRGEPLSLDRALARSRQEVYPEGFPILTSSTWLIIYLAYLLPISHCNQMFFVLRSIFPYLPHREKPLDVTLWRHHNLWTYAFKN